MNRPSHNIMGNMYRSPRPFNNSWTARGPYPPATFPCRPNTYHGTYVTDSSKENNEDHWCETCDRGFPTAVLLDKHKLQHQKCNIDGCQFVAHPKVITKHIQMQHSSGLYKKIAKLDNPEEINKWREERKKKYPTRTNIEKKAAECKEKIERGEKMALKHDRNDSRRNTDHTSGNKRRHSFDKNNQNLRGNRSNLNQRQNRISNNNQQPPKKVPRVIPDIPSVLEKNKLKPFAGILSIDMDDTKTEDSCDTPDCNSTLIEDDYYEEPVPAKSMLEKPQEPVLCGALSSLLCDYGSSDEETDVKENKVLSNVAIVDPEQSTDKDSTPKVVDNVNNDTKKDVESIKCDTSTDVAQDITTESNAKDANSDDDSPEEVKTVKSNDTETNVTQQELTKSVKPPVSSKKNISARNNYRPYNKYKPKIPSTLLYKLLHKEIKKERNIVLQCIRYIKKMNYFDKTV